MKKIYLDNAATTAMDPRVLETMLPYLQNTYGNPSSVHGYGREARSLIEKARRKVADLFTVSPSEIFFTSGGTESDNTILWDAILHKGIKHIITSAIEHHAVLHTVEYLQKSGWCTVSLVPLDTAGAVDLDALEQLCAKHPHSLVTLMHANNEIGNLLDIHTVGQICKAYGCIFHSDTVQTVGQIAIPLKNTAIEYIVGSAHKFHGPKGIGFLYANSPISPMIHGGAQERNVRGGTENLHGIIGLAKALELSYAEMSTHQNQIMGLKKLLIHTLQAQIPDVVF
ncbi:MAG TPA: cysteine desulfurase family protein, partial [Cytophagales bacterium]|nr:cysteine desulfurase family protein [Cytophagales bacterium]